MKKMRIESTIYRSAHGSLEGSQGHTPRKWQNQDSSSDLPDLRPRLGMVFLSASRGLTHFIYVSLRGGIHDSLC